MLREYRFKLGGLIFFILIFGIFLSTTEGDCLIFNSLNDQMGSILLALFGLLAIYASSEGFGYIFNSIFFALWSRVRPRFIQKTNSRGYSAEQEKYFHAEHMRNRILNWSQEQGKNIPEAIKNYSLETYYWYFFQKFAPTDLNGWIERRWTHFAVGMTEIVAITFAWIFSFCVIFEEHWTMTLNTGIIFIFSIIFGLICYYNAILSRNDALQMMDLWIYANFDADGKYIFNKFENEINKNRSPTS
jgi:hypothetical protein